MNDNNEELEEGLGQYVSILATIASFMVIPDVMAKDDIVKELKNIPQKELNISNPKVQNAIKNASTDTKTYGGYSATNAINMAARTIYVEGLGLEHNERLAIASAMFNRANGDFNNIPDVIKKPSAFSCWNKMTKSDWTNFKYRVPPTVLNNKHNESVWKDAVEIATQLYKGEFKSTIGRCNSYYNPKKVKSIPSWDKQLQDVISVGTNGFVHKYGYLTSEDPTKINTNVAKTKPTKSTIHVVKKGETVSQIAKKYNTTVKDIQKKNGIKDMNRISIGQKLKV